jgi:hypothetical protein
MSDAKLFVGSSSEGLRVARAIRSDLERRKGINVSLWDKGIFHLSESTSDSLARAASEYDFAVLVVSPDDIVISRREETFGPRDNVVFELGLFAGSLGRERTFIVVNNLDKPKLPSDIAGVTYAVYDNQENSESERGVPEVGSACDLIMEAVKRLGRLRHPTLERTLFSIISNYRRAFKVEHVVFQNHLERWARNTKDESEVWGEGLLRISFDYGLFLADMYRRAEKNICSTTIPAYSKKIWKAALKSPLALGKVLLKAQQANRRAKSKRIFIYSNERSITTDDVAIMKMHQHYHVAVYVYIDSQYPDFEYGPKSIERDWTIIDDGKAIGVTKRIDVSKREAHWYFNNIEKAQEYCVLKDNLLRMSLPLQEWLGIRKAG